MWSLIYHEVPTAVSLRHSRLLRQSQLSQLSAQSKVDTTKWTAAEDHQNMMDQLGIKALRPGPSGNESAPNHANYDEATANPFPNLPEVLTLKNGKKVTTAAMWWNQRRPEIVEDFEREVLGRIPKTTPKVTWEVTKTAEAMVGNHPVIGKQLLGHVDNSSDPDIQVDIQMTVVLPADAKGPVPVMMMFGGRTIPEIAFPAPVFPGRGGAPGGGPQPPAVDPRRLQRTPTRLQPSNSSPMVGDLPPSTPAAFRPITAPVSPKESLAWSTRASRVSRMTGARCGPGDGALRAASTISKQTKP